VPVCSAGDGRATSNSESPTREAALFFLDGCLGDGGTGQKPKWNAEKTGKVNGRLTHERFDKDGSDGEYSVLVGERFLVEARGRNVDMAALKNAFDAIAPAQLEAMKDEGVKR
jgi:hypothetical protein